MTNQEIFEIMSFFDKSSSKTMKLSLKDFSLELSKCEGAVMSPSPVKMAGATAAEPVKSEIAPSAPSAYEQAITSPMVGTFYVAREPGAEPYVAVGDRVKKGDIVCLMEAMKMISEVHAPCDCIIRQVLKENGEMAEFGESLFRYEPC